MGPSLLLAFVGYLHSVLWLMRLKRTLFHEEDIITFLKTYGTEWNIFAGKTDEFGKISFYSQGLQ